jgi:hypothetical protein
MTLTLWSIKASRSASVEGSSFASKVGGAASTFQEEKIMNIARKAKRHFLIAGPVVKFLKNDNRGYQKPENI